MICLIEEREKKSIAHDHVEIYTTQKHIINEMWKLFKIRGNGL